MELSEDYLHLMTIEEKKDRKNGVGNAIISQLMCVCATLIAHH